MLNFFKVIYSFSKTFYFYARSLIHPEHVLDLKKKWAETMLKDFGYELQEIGLAPKLDEVFILVGNHISFLDIFVLMSVNKKVNFVAKKEVRSWPVVGISAARVGTLFVDRSPSADRKAVRAKIAAQIQKEKTLMTVFPSGTTSLVENKVWKKGVFEISKENAVPIKAFKIKYEPLRESAYIDDDHLLTQMMNMHKIKNKKVTLEWLDVFEVDQPEATAEKIRRLVELA